MFILHMYRAYSCVPPIPVGSSMNDTDTIAYSLPDGNVMTQLRPITDIANAAFTLQQESAAEQVSPLLRHIKRIVECLKEIGIDIENHTDQPFASDMPLEVIAFQPAVGLEHDKVIDTIKPTIYLRGYRIQTGQVIVATPESFTTSS